MGEGHISVLAREVCDALEASLPRVGETPHGVYVDATCGAGGHIAAVLERFSPARVIAFDRDETALERARTRLCDAATPILFVHAPFSALGPTLEAEGVQADGILADLGVSSMQLDQGARGFSFRADAPLDMRMDQSRSKTAANLLEELDLPSLIRILREYGEEPDAPRIARAILDARPKTTGALAQTVADAMSHKQRRKLGLRIHPATRTFQAIRIHLNDELGELDTLLTDGPASLSVGGRLAIITFHSLEDRRVKQRFRKLSRPADTLPGLPIPESERQAPYSLPKPFAKGVTAAPDETDHNPRARSARLRVLERVA
ncbi:MAG: 16S rRNA (cytosine(1402)-N(4))-methyltransferase RsmH [Nannocystaceae bacterium]|nr:16S rRNA (cytosine(1402)-N(4))-methyltransferase RsmH [bacterium]